MQTYLGLTQRTVNGRFLYGRTKNYRLNSCLLCLRNPDNDLGSIDPVDGDSPLTVTGTIPDIAVATLTPGINNNWPAPAAGGMSSTLPGGGIAVQGLGYARVDDADAIAVSQTWVWGDGSEPDSVAVDTDTDHEYEDSGSFIPNLVCGDALGRNNAQVMPSISVDAGAPTGLVATGGSLEIDLEWDPTPDAVTYNVYRSTTSGGSQTLIASGLTDPAYTDSPLAVGTTRFYKVAAVNAEGIGAQSSEVSATTLCAVVANPAATGGLLQIGLTWDATTGAATYNVYRSDTSGGSQTLVASGVAVTNYTDTGLPSATERFYKIAAVNGAGIGPKSTEVSATTLCAAPANPVATGGALQIGLTWDATTGAATYKVFRSTTTGGTFTELAAGVAVTNYTDSPLGAAETWFYKIKATNVTGDGPFSAEVNATTDP